MITAIDHKRARLQDSPYFCVFKYVRAVKQRVWNEVENSERDLGETLKIQSFFFLSLSLSLSPHTHALWAYACEARALCARQNLAPDF